MRPAEHLADVGEAAIDAALVARQQPLLIELPASAVAALAALSPSDADVAPADAADTAALLDALPDHVGWRTASDVLAHLPEGAEPTSVAHLRLTDAAVAQEDVRGAIWAQVLLPSGEEASAEWLVVSRADKAAAVAEWRREGRWPTADALARVGVASAVTLTQRATQILLLPPHALAVRRAAAAARGAVHLLQWCRVSVAAAAATFDAAAAQRADGGDAACARALPAAEDAQLNSELGWRRVQLLPPIGLATFLALGALAAQASHSSAPPPKGGARPPKGAAETGAEEGGEAAAARRARLTALLPLCRGLLDAERVENGSMSAVGLGKLQDHAPRACDRCHAEIFNRCVRVRAPLARKPCAPDATPDDRLEPLPARPNPRRDAPRKEGAPGDFCLRTRLGRTPLPHAPRPGTPS